jgi:hypothetical protein
MSNADCITLNSDGSFESNRDYEDTSAKLSSDSDGNLNINLEFNNNRKRARFERESFTYSPRRGISNLKVDFILGESSRRVSNDRVNLEYSSARRLIFEAIQRDTSSIEIIPNSDAVFEESIYLDRNRTIKLISGSSQISIDGTISSMILDRIYQLPNIETELDRSYKARETSTELSLKSGWNLVGSPIDNDITDPFIFGNYDSIYIYDNGIWYKNPDSISYHLGFWIKSNDVKDLNFSGTSHLIDFNSLLGGWNLVSSGDSFDTNETFLDYQIDEIWRYRNGEFEKLSSLSQINFGEGLWVQKRDSTATLSIQKGWNLKSPPTVDGITDISIFKDFDSIYLYRDSNWIKDPSSITVGEGFWIYSYIDLNLPFYSGKYEADLSDIDGKIWKLKGGYIENLNSIDSDREFWLYQSGSWITRDAINSISSGEGFWVK